MPVYYNVSADHVSPNHAFFAREFKVTQAYDGTYYASGHTGCSKPADTPENAIRNMLLEHACTNIRIHKIAD